MIRHLQMQPSMDNDRELAHGLCWLPWRKGARRVHGTSDMSGSLRRCERSCAEVAILRYLPWLPQRKHCSRGFTCRALLDEADMSKVQVGYWRNMQDFDF